MVKIPASRAHIYIYMYSCNSFTCVHMNTYLYTYVYMYRFMYHIYFQLGHGSHSASGEALADLSGVRVPGLCRAVYSDVNSYGFVHSLQ